MNKIVEFIAKHKVVVICRGLHDNGLIKTIRALCDGSIRVVEVTSDQTDSDAVKKTRGTVRTIKKHLPQMKVGSGTVTCVKHVLATEGVGGGFYLSPDTNTEAIRATKEAGLIPMPGAITSAEILRARNTGADIMKIFPTGWPGLSYLKDIKGPINHVRFLAVAGVNEESFREYLNAGYCAAGISDRFIN